MESETLCTNNIRPRLVRRFTCQFVSPRVQSSAGDDTQHLDIGRRTQAEAPSCIMYSLSPSWCTQCMRRRWTSGA